MPGGGGYDAGGGDDARGVGGRTDIYTQTDNDENITFPAYAVGNKDREP